MLHQYYELVQIECRSDNELVIVQMIKFLV